MFIILKQRFCFRKVGLLINNASQIDTQNKSFPNANIFVYPNNSTGMFFNYEELDK